MLNLKSSMALDVAASHLGGFKTTINVFLFLLLRKKGSYAVKNDDDMLNEQVYYTKFVFLFLSSWRYIAKGYKQKLSFITQ